MPGSRTQRLFFALWPPPAVVENIAALLATLDLDGRRTKPVAWHITLAFHGSCDAAARERLIARAAGIDSPSIDLQLDRVAGFTRPRLIWLGPSIVPISLRSLAVDLGFSAPNAKAVVPHVTLARDATWSKPVPVTPIAWRAHEFCLVESGANGVAGAYRILARWSLGGADPASPSVK